MKSKTCTGCGEIHTTLGGSKVFECPNCGHKLPRDWNGALGFLLRALRDTSFTISDDGVAIAALSALCAVLRRVNVSGSFNSSRNMRLESPSEASL